MEFRRVQRAEAGVLLLEGFPFRFGGVGCCEVNFWIAHKNSQTPTCRRHGPPIGRQASVLNWPPATQPSFASDFHLQILPPNTASRFHFTVLYEDLQVEKERDNSEIGLNLQSEFDNPSPRFKLVLK